MAVFLNTNLFLTTAPCNKRAHGAHKRSPMLTSLEETRAPNDDSPTGTKHIRYTQRLFLVKDP